MDIPGKIRDTVAAAEARVMQALRNLIQITAVTRSTSKGEEDGADGWPDAGKAYQRATRRMQHFGFRSRPPKNTAAVMLLVGGGNASEVTVAEGSDGYGPDDLADGAAAVFSSGDARVVADGADVIVNDGTEAVGRVGDAVHVPVSTTPTSLTFNVEDHLGVTGTLTISVAGGALAVALAPPTLAPPLVITASIAKGADHFKA